MSNISPAIPLSPPTPVEMPVTACDAPMSPQVIEDSDELLDWDYVVDPPVRGESRTVVWSVTRVAERIIPDPSADD